MTSKAHDPCIIRTIETLAAANLNFWFKYDNEFHNIQGIKVNNKGILFYKNNQNENIIAARYLKEITGLQTVRWLNYLYFTDGSGNIQNFKTFMTKTHGCRFS